MYRLGAVFELRHEDAADHSTLTLNKSVDVHTLDDHPGSWHTNREGGRAILVTHLAISCRDPKRLRAVFELQHEEGAGRSTLTLRNVREVAGPHRITTRGGCRTQHANSARPSGVWLRALIEFRHEEGAGHNGLGQR